MKRSAVGLVLLTGLISYGLIGSADAASTKFSPYAHETQLLRLLDTYPGSPHDINRLRIFPSPIDATWVQYAVGIPVTGGSGGTQEDWAVGYAHYVHGRWINVVGPGSGFCVIPSSVRKIPVAIRKSLRVGC